MKKPITLLLIFFLVGIFSSPASAVGGVGESCCPSGYETATTGCVNKDLSNLIKNYESTACNGPARIVQLAALPSGAQLADFAMNTVYNACRKQISALLINAASSRNTQALCDGTREIVLTNLSAITAIAQIIPQVRQEFNNTCQAWATPMVNAIADVSKANVSFVCDKTTAPYCVKGRCSKTANRIVYGMCDTIPDTGPNSGKKQCEDCLVNGGVSTAFGCMKYSPEGFIKSFLQLALGIAGGVALMLMAYGAFQITISTGDPKKAQEGRDTITSAIAGLLLIIFSVVLLKFIGVEILQIPGL